jgi:hypothetical protein
MALQFSTQFRNDLLDTGDLSTLFGGTIKVYAGTVPENADAALGGATLLVEYSLNDTGADVAMAAAAVGGALGKDGAQTWSGTAVATGTATFFRYEESGDTGGAVTNERRIQGTVGGAGADLFVTSTSFTSGTLYTMDYFSISIPV